MVTVTENYVKIITLQAALDHTAKWQLNIQCDALKNNLMSVSGDRNSDFQIVVLWKPITVAARSNSNTGIVGSNSTRGMDVCVRLFCVCVVLCVDSGLATG
jgi:hypothetical protein